MEYLPLRLALRALAAVTLPVALAAQARTPGAAVLPAARPQRCAPVPVERGPTITFGRFGGNILPRSVAIGADGRITAGLRDSARDSVTTVPAAAVAALARLARSGGFWELRPPTVRRPPRNPDFAREFIEVTLTCGRKRVEFISDAEPGAFNELFALLSAVARSP